MAAIHPQTPAARMPGATRDNNMVPGNALVHKRLRGIRPGNIIQARGYLVDAEHQGGFSWRTSLSREDTGDGSCELFYVERLDIEN